MRCWFIFIFLVCSLVPVMHGVILEKEIYDVLGRRKRAVGEIVSIDKRKIDDCDTGQTLCNFIEGPYASWAYPRLHFRLPYLAQVSFLDSLEKTHVFAIGIKNDSSSIQVGKKVEVLYELSSPDQDPILNPVEVTTSVWHVDFWWRKLLAVAFFLGLFIFCYKNENCCKNR